MGKFIFRYIIFAGFVTFIAHPVNAQWEQTSGPVGGIFSAIAINGNTIFAGAQVGGVFRSTDNGISWTPLNSDLSNEQILSLAVSDSTIFAGTWRGTFKSTDNGNNWAKVDSGFEGTIIGSLAKGAKIFAGTNNSKNWTEIRISGIPYEIRSFAICDSTIFAGTRKGVFRSTDNGTNWTEVDSGITYIVTLHTGGNVVVTPEITSLAVNGSTIFAGSSEEGIFCSNDYGTSWIRKNAGLTNSKINGFAVSDSIIFAGTYSGIFRSIDNGTSWTLVNSCCKNNQVLSFVVRDSTILAGTNGGVFRSTDTGKTWQNANFGIRNTTVRTIAVLGRTIFTAIDNQGLFRSTDNGTRWMPVNSGLTINNIEAIAIIDNTIFAGGIGGIFRSTDNGTNWATANSGLTDTNILSITIMGNNIYAGTKRDGVFFSSTNGNSWTHINSRVLDFKSVNTIAVSNSTIFAGTDRGLFISSDSGTSWKRVDSVLTYWDPASGTMAGYQIYSIAVNGNTVFATSYGGGVFRSSDNGTSWTVVDSGLTDKVFNSVLVSNGNIFICGSGVYLSTNNGTSWTAVNSGLNPGSTLSLAVIGDTIFAGTFNHSVWRRSISEMTGSTNVYPPQKILNRVKFKIVPQSPTGSTIAIEFTIPHSNQVVITMHNLSGREITSLVNNYLKAGSYKYLFDMRDVVQGCYIVNLCAGTSKCSKIVQFMH